jgi:predicted nucleic acid-binding protein
MRLVLDTSVVVGELLRATGRQRLGDERLDLFLAEQKWNETQVEIPRRIGACARARGLEPAVADRLVELAIAAVDANLTVLDEAVYAAAEDEARARCPRDPTDWTAVACALLLNAGIWTNDNDFLGTGVPTWTTATLQAWLDRQPPAEHDR